MPEIRRKSCGLSDPDGFVDSSKQLKRSDGSYSTFSLVTRCQKRAPQGILLYSFSTCILLRQFTVPRMFNQINFHLINKSSITQVGNCVTDILIPFDDEYSYCFYRN